MNAAEFFQDVVKPNYEVFIKNPSDFRSLWNALVSMNTVAEFVALEQLAYDPISRGTLTQTAEQLRDQNLADLKFCAEALKHVRKIDSQPKLDPKFTTVGTSTGILSNDRASWTIGSFDLVDVLQRASTTLATFPELK
jgi:hypothetical protein